MTEQNELEKYAQETGCILPLTLSELIKSHRRQRGLIKEFQNRIANSLDKERKLAYDYETSRIKDEGMKEFMRNLRTMTIGQLAQFLCEHPDDT